MFLIPKVVTCECICTVFVCILLYRLNVSILANHHFHKKNWLCLKLIIKMCCLCIGAKVWYLALEWKFKEAEIPVAFISHIQLSWMFANSYLFRVNLTCSPDAKRIGETWGPFYWCFTGFNYQVGWLARTRPRRTHFVFCKNLVSDGHWCVNKLSWCLQQLMRDGANANFL